MGKCEVDALLGGILGGYVMKIFKPILASLFLSFVVSTTSLFSMDSSSSTSTTTSTQEWFNLSDDELEDRYVEGASLLDIKHVFQSAPEMVKNCVEHLKDPDFYPAPGYRALFLYGPSGSGKSTLARAIALYANWDLTFCTPSDFQIGNRNDAAEKLRKKVDELLQKDVPIVLVIDEINQLLENAESKSHDNDATSKEFWTTIDRVFGKHKFFIIGTSNRIHKLPSQIKTRIKGKACLIAGPETLDKKIDIFCKKMNRKATRLAPDVMNYVVFILEKNPKWTPRDYEDLAFIAKDVFREQDKKTKPMVFDLAILQEAVKRSNKFEDDSLYYSEDMTDEERQDLYQAQTIHTQLLVQKLQKHNAMGLRAPGLNNADANAIADLVLTDQQKKLVEDKLDAGGIKQGTSTQNSSIFSYFK